MSPIQGLTPRLPEAGRIRIGHTVTGQRQDGSQYQAPAKLEHFRFTSFDGGAIRALAALYGGEPTESVGGRMGATWELYSETSELSVLVPPASVSFSQWLEEWSGGGCVHRCNGEWDRVAGAPCARQGPGCGCKPTTRLALILADLPSTGSWRFETHSEISANELAGVMELATLAGQKLQPGRLVLEERKIKVPGEKAKEFMVARLDLSLPVRTGGPMAPALPDPPRRALPGPRLSAEAAEQFVRERVHVLGEAVHAELNEAMGPAPAHGDTDGWNRVVEWLREHYPLAAEPRGDEGPPEDDEWEDPDEVWP